jgi:predicted small lipoprotein YifL
MNNLTWLKLPTGQFSFFGDLTMKKLFASMVVCAALVAVGCGERDTTTTPPANDATPATPAEDGTMEETPAETAPAGETGA